MPKWSARCHRVTGRVSEARNEIGRVRQRSILPFVFILAFEPPDLDFVHVCGSRGIENQGHIGQ